MTMNTKTHLHNELTDNKEQQRHESNEKLDDKEQALAPNDGASQQLAEMDQALLAQNTANHEQTESLPLVATTLAKQHSRSNQ